jgi:hypothetical protein
VLSLRDRHEGEQEQNGVPIAALLAMVPTPVGLEWITHGAMIVQMPTRAADTPMP